MTFAQHVSIVRALSLRALNEILRVPGGAIPGVLAPTIFMVGLSGVFGEAARLPGFDATDFRTFIVPVGMLQGAGFTGAATGVNLARDIEQGWFDRLLVGPAPRWVLLLGIVGSASLRALLPATFLVVVAVLLGTDVESLGGLALATVFIMGTAAAWACWGTMVALRFKTQQAAPLMQVLAFASILFTTAYAPEELLADWLAAVADVNPVRYILEGVRQAFVTGVSGDVTLQAFAAMIGLLAFFGAFAIRGMSRLGN
ncbi:MAG: ABC transporter permease [Actinomycetota bacterium]|nr:ABC transporter permease [Actinomycetota bacterium]